MEKIIVKINGEIRIEKKNKTLEITLSPIQENKVDELAKELSELLIQDKSEKTTKLQCENTSELIKCNPILKGKHCELDLVTGTLKLF